MARGHLHSLSRRCRRQRHRRGGRRSDRAAPRASAPRVARLAPSPLLPVRCPCVGLIASRKVARTSTSYLQGSRRARYPIGRRPNAKKTQPRIPCWSGCLGMSKEQLWRQPRLPYTGIWLRMHASDKYKYVQSTAHTLVFIPLCNFCAHKMQLVRAVLCGAGIAACVAHRSALCPVLPTNGHNRKRICRKTRSTSHQLQHADHEAARAGRARRRSHRGRGADRHRHSLRGGARERRRPPRAAGAAAAAACCGAAAAGGEHQVRFV